MQTTLLALGKPLVLMLLMMGAAVLALVSVPTRPLADAWANESLDQMLPEQFDEWRVDSSFAPIVPDPSAAESLAQVYTETVSRTYVSESGGRIMVSVAYGRDQRGEGRAHYPEVCYPAQGFQVGRKATRELFLNSTRLAVNTLVATSGGRIEPISYWTVVGEKVVDNILEHKRAILSYALDGAIADGLLFRISSIDSDPDRAYDAHGAFARALYSHVSPRARIRFFGTPSGQPLCPNCE